MTSDKRDPPAPTGDERSKAPQTAALLTPLGDDERTRRGPVRADPQFAARGPADDAREDVALASDDAMIDEFLQSFGKTSLPVPPSRDPNWHYCWITTTNPRDPVVGRLRLGYKLVKVEEFPELAGYHLTSGEHMGCLGVNEMVLAKIPLATFQKIMTIVHHKRPREEEAAIKAKVDQMTAGVNARRGVVVATAEGFQDVVQNRARVPVFQG